MKFDMKEGLIALRAKYNAKELQFDLPKEYQPGYGCQYFTEHDGKLYTCAVGAMMEDYKSEILENDMNTEIGVQSLLRDSRMSFGSPDYAVIHDLSVLQEKHDDVVCYVGHQEQFDKYRGLFEAKLVELEQKYGATCPTT